MTTPATRPGERTFHLTVICPDGTEYGEFQDARDAYDALGKWAKAVGFDGPFCGGFPHPDKPNARVYFATRPNPRTYDDTRMVTVE